MGSRDFLLLRLFWVLVDIVHVEILGLGTKRTENPTFHHLSPTHSGAV